MKTRLMYILLIAAIMLAVFSGCSLGAQTQPEEAPDETPSVLEVAAPMETPPVLEEAESAETFLASGSEPPVETTISTTQNLGFSFWGNQIDIESLPEYIPHKNVLFSIRNLSETEKEFYILFAQVHQYLHSGKFDFVSAYQQSTSSNEFGSDVFAVFDFTAPQEKQHLIFGPLLSFSMRPKLKYTI